MTENKQPEWGMEEIICSYDVDPHQTVRLPALCRFMQEIAYHHAEHLGLGHSFLAAQGMGWVLARQRIAVNQLPKWGDRIHIRTWPSGRDRLFFHRDFEITLSGRRVLIASNAWSLIDIEKRERVHPDHYLRADIPESESLFDERPARLKSCSDTGGETLLVTYGDLDLNGHVNNVRYIEWVLNSLPLGFHEMHTVKEMECNYLAEAVYGQTLSVYSGETGPRQFDHLIKAGDLELFRARSNWSETGD